MVNTLFKKFLGKNEKCVFHFYLTEGTSIWPLTAFPILKTYGWYFVLFLCTCGLGSLESERLWRSSSSSSCTVLGKLWNSSFLHSTIISGTSLVVQWLRLRAPNVGGPGLIPGQGTRSHILQLRVCMLQLKIPHAATEDPIWRNEGPTHSNKDPTCCN